jgi:phenylalanyl-tRNA synthetase beta chain
MKILETILKNLIEVPKDVFEVTNQKIIEVESFDQLNTSTDLVIGHVLTCVDHPNSDHLHVTTVDIGKKIEQIVCGADNVAQGQYVIVAQVGSVLPGDFKIKATKIRGVESNGMICSLKELGFEDKYIPEAFKEGIYYFDYPQEIGKPALEVLFLSGFVMELALTPNRGDLLSHLGFAYDLASMCGLKVNLPTPKVVETKTKNPIKVQIETDGCGRYYARHLTHIQIKESPWWLKSALIASDIKPINNVVDISNYVLLEYGTPLHMFDAKKVQTNHIIVRDAHSKEKVVTLDDESRTLEQSDVVITNGKEVIAVAGVMGLSNTMIDEHTTEVIIEAAYFDPKRIQKTSKRLGLRSDSSLRFERGIDDERVLLGLERATELLISLADAKVSQGISEALRYEVKNPTITISKDYINRALGTDINEVELKSYFKALNYDVKVLDKTYQITAPSYRKDILIDADILEEIARIHGLNLIPLHAVDKPLLGKLSFKQKRIRAIRHALADLGLNEIISYSLLDTDEVQRYHRLGEAVSVLMPLSEDMKTLRQSLINGLLETVKYNQSRQIESVSIFEVGHVFAKDKEVTHLGLALSGPWHELPWKKEVMTPDFYVMKGIVERLFQTIDVSFSYQSTSEISSYHPYRQAHILYQNQVIGTIAELHPQEVKRLGIKPTVVLEISLEELLYEKKELIYQGISKYPSISRDLAIVVGVEVPAGELMDMIKQTAKKQLIDLEVFDVYQGSHIETGKKSIAFSLVFNDAEKTLGSEDVDALMKKITNRLAFTYQAAIRS